MTIYILYTLAKIRLDMQDHSLKAWVGQNMIIEKKFAPEMNVITKVRAKIRGACFRRDGNMGYFAP